VKTTTEKGRSQEGLLVYVECKRTGEMGIAGGLLKRRAVAALKKEEEKKRKEEKDEEEEKK
jgi:hypothetical protein